MDDSLNLLMIIIIAAICIFLIFIVPFCICSIFRSPFHYPYFIYYFDISGKRNPHIEDLIDTLLIKNGLFVFQNHMKMVEEWEDDCKRLINKSRLKGYRQKQFQECLDSDHMFQFKLTRMQTRYRQFNYIKDSYKVSQVVKTYSCDYTYLLERNKLLKDISYELPLRQYHSKNQRKLMTRELREKVIRRDNYTCQICGKYMPDEVGLQIDHIIPVSKGGKTVLSNLQVTCSKCNAHKKDKIIY